MMFSRHRWCFGFTLLCALAFTALMPANAQSDACSLPMVIASFEAAALSDSVELWQQRYEDSDCSAEVLRAVELFAQGYEAYFNEVVIVEPSVFVTLNSRVNVRSGPGSNYPIITAFPSGTQLPVVARNNDSSWYLITMPTGGQAWIVGAFVTISGDPSTVEIAATLPAPP